MDVNLREDAAACLLALAVSGRRSSYWLTKSSWASRKPQAPLPGPLPALCHDFNDFSPLLRYLEDIPQQPTSGEQTLGSTAAKGQAALPVPEEPEAWHATSLCSPQEKRGVTAETHRTQLAAAAYTCQMSLAR